MDTGRRKERQAGIQEGREEGKEGRTVVVLACFTGHTQPWQREGQEEDGGGGGEIEEEAKGGKRERRGERGGEGGGRGRC